MWRAQRDGRVDQSCTGDRPRTVEAVECRCEELPYLYGDEAEEYAARDGTLGPSRSDRRFCGSACRVATHRRWGPRRSRGHGQRNAACLALQIGLAVVALAAVGCGNGNDGDSAPKVEIVATDTTKSETSTSGPPKLIGTVGSTDDPDAYEISLTTEDGAEVTTVLPPGEYMLEINDQSTIHNFHLGARRAGVDVATDVAGTDEKTTTVVFQDGEAYIYACDAHPAKMNVTFSIHSAGYGRRTR